MFTIGGSMSFAFYSSGEKDYEEGEITYILPKDWRTYDGLKPQEDKKLQEAIIVLPRELDSAYYEEKRNKYPLDSRDWWDWEKIRNYAQTTSKFLRSTFQEFVKRYKIDLSNQKIPAFLLKYSDFDIDRYAVGQSKKESYLVQQFSNGRRSFVTNKINRHKTLERLQSRALLAWGYYYACKGYYPINQTFTLRKMRDNLPNANDTDIIKMYALCEKTKYHLLKLDKNISSTGMEYYAHGSRSSELYPDVKMLDLHNEVMHSFGFDSSDIFDSTITELQPKLKEISNNDLNRRIIGFYQHFVIMRRLIWKMKCINEKLDLGLKQSFAYDDILQEIFPDEGTVDLYKRSCTYYKSCDALLEHADEMDVRFVKDIEDITERFATVINTANKYYRDSHLLDVEVDEELLNRYSKKD